MTREIKEIQQLAKKEGQYQDIIIKGKKVVDGWRECDKRWEQIEPYISDKKVYMDIGSHYGYFSMKIAEKCKESVVWSIEPCQTRYEIQRKALELNGYKNIALTTKKINILELLKLKQSCEAIDTIVCLSTLHYFEKEEQLYIINLFSKIARTLIIEYPNVKEKNVAEKQNIYTEDEFGRIINQNYDNSYIIGVAKSPDGTIDRKIYFGDNRKVVKNKVMDCINHLSNRTQNLKFNKDHWILNDKKRFKVGINNYDIIYHNVVYPYQDNIYLDVAKEYKKLINNGEVPTDISIRNSLLTPYGYKIIDYKEKFKKNVYNCTLKQYKKALKNINTLDLAGELKDKQ